MKVEVTVNHDLHRLEVEPRTSLAETLREQLGLIGTRIGCDTTSCGACTVLLDGDPVKSCTLLTVQADGSHVTTIEGLTPGEGLSPVQEAFRDEHALQCGFCTPGFVVSVTALLAAHPDPADEQMEEALEGNLCRCTGYINILRAVRRAAALARGEVSSEPEAGRSHAEPLAVRQVQAPAVDEGTDDVEVV